METLEKKISPLQGYSIFGDSRCEDEIFIDQYGPSINSDNETEIVHSEIIREDQYDEDLEEFFEY